MSNMNRREHGKKPWFRNGSKTNKHGIEVDDHASNQRVSQTYTDYLRKLADCASARGVMSINESTVIVNQLIRESEHICCDDHHGNTVWCNKDRGDAILKRFREILRRKVLDHAQTLSMDSKGPFIFHVDSARIATEPKLTLHDIPEKARVLLTPEATFDVLHLINLSRGWPSFANSAGY
jgi:hypothetical protein